MVQSSNLNDICAIEMDLNVLSRQIISEIVCHNGRIFSPEQLYTMVKYEMGFWWTEISKMVMVNDVIVLYSVLKYSHFVC